jgi:hypothetical protein
MSTPGEPASLLRPGRRPRSGLGQLARWLADDISESGRALSRKFRPGRRVRLPEWAAPKSQDRDFALIAGYHELRRTEPGAVSIDDRTWSDLHLDSVYARIDRCVSPVGEQMLYDILRAPANEDAILHERHAAAERMTASPQLRHAVQEAQAPLRVWDAYFLPNLFQEGLPQRPRLWFVFPILTLLALAMMVLLWFQPLTGLIGLFAVAVTNLVIQYRYHNRIQPVVRPLTVLRRLLAAASETAQLDDNVLRPRLVTLRQLVVRLQPLSRVSRWIAIEGGAGGDLLSAAYAYINMLLLIDVNAFVFSVDAVTRHRADIRAVWESLGFLDAAVAIGSWRAGLSTWSPPDFVETARYLEVRNLVHPLIDGAVGNDLIVDGNHVLITGSNMAGKTTFIRAVALNAVLAQTVYTCTAQLWRSQRLRVRTLISRGDDLARGQSYFGVELELTRDLVHAADNENPHLFVIDEIFRGTNTVERVAAARAVLQRLASNDHIVLAATHDLELLPLLGNAWDFHHFRESIDDGTLSFDYRLRPGPTSTHNAIRLMELYGFPQDVVAEARSTVDRIESAMGRTGHSASPDTGSLHDG